MRYVKRFVYSGYSSAKCKVLFYMELEHFQNSDYSSANRKSRWDNAMWQMGVLARRATVCARFLRDVSGVLTSGEADSGF
jgi:hypothetical protein